LKTVLSAEAEANLRQIAFYIAADNPRRAISFTKELRSCARSISRAPRAYPVVPDQEARGIRRRVYKHYLIFYRIEGNTVIVTHILNAAQDYGKLINPFT
jgi:toxin ParE1/3/4